MSEHADIKKQRVRDDFSKAVASYDTAAVLQHEVCERTLERVDMLKLQPRRVLDVGTATGRSLKGLASRFPNSSMVACDLALPMLLWCRRHHDAEYTNALVCNDAEQLPFADGSVDLVFSSSTFQWCVNLPQVFSECMRVLRIDGVLIFSTFGPDTLHQLRDSFARLDDYRHVHEFVDMHHIGDMLLAEQFTDPVVDMEMIDIQYQSLLQLLQDLKNTGSRGKFGSAHVTPTGLMGRQKYRSLVQAYEEYRQDNGMLPASYEVIYGYARKSAKPVSEAADDNEVRIPVDHLQGRNR
ncbi:MAG: malonyl-ACP O-methyltransferase BioC [Gammaproteobacteria bacterium]|nr:malonyl-ACP O-methyltransferase BioC [Gammaproteobacteria bacterium]